MATLTFTPSRNHLKTAKELWKLQGEPDLIRNHQNPVYNCSTREMPAILRFTDPAHRDLKELQAELEWILYLSENDVSVAIPKRSIRQRYVEELTDAGRKCFASLFTKAAGDPLDPGKISSTALFHWGRALGKIHRLSVNYAPEILRKNHHEHARYQFDPISKQSTDPSHGAIGRLEEWLTDLPTDPTVYGMIHGDAANFHIQSNQITFFDFDDCTYHWFAYDIANGLYSLMFDLETSDTAINFEACMENFLAGYREIKQLDPPWDERISGFIHYRTALLNRWLLVPEAGPLWVARIDDSWRAFLLEWAEKKLSEKLKLV